MIVGLILQVIDETLRLVTFSLTVFREAKKDVKVNGIKQRIPYIIIVMFYINSWSKQITMSWTGYTIPKGWKVLVWFRTVHHDEDIYPEPLEFNPSRWDVSFIFFLE